MDYNCSLFLHLLSKTKEAGKETSFYWQIPLQHIVHPGDPANTTRAFQQSSFIKLPRLPSICAYMHMCHLEDENSHPKSVILDKPAHLTIRVLWVLVSDCETSAATL